MPHIKKSCGVLLILAFQAAGSSQVPSDSSVASFFDVFNNLGVSPAASQGSSTLSMIDENDNWTMGTEWTPQPTYDETDIFHVELQHRSSGQDWNIRIGKGGQLYSWNLLGTGELIPPQGHHDGGSPWVDDVVLMTWRDSENHDTNATMNGEFYGNGFVHAAGMYIRPDLDPINDKPFYCPMLAQKFSSSDRSYMCINWGVTPTPSINRSDILFYHQYRHLGGGVLEITYYGYNFGETRFSDNAFPWAMVRNSIFPNTIRSLPSGNGFESWGNGAYPIRFNLKDQGGWITKTANASNSSSLSISTVHGTDRHFGSSWQNGASFCSSGISGVPNSTRDISIMTAVNRSDIEPGTGFFWRTYMVLGTQSSVVSKSYSLVGQVDYGPVEFSESSSEIVPLYATTLEGQNVLTTQKPEENVVPLASCYALPVKNSVPLILMKDVTNGQYYLSTDPYAICGKMPFVNSNYPNRHVYQPYDETTEWIALLGYVMPTSKATVTANTATLDSVIGNNYPFLAGEKYASNELLVRLDGFYGTHEAEAYSSSSGTSSSSLHTGFTGSGYADMGGNGSWFEWNNVETASGTTTLTFRYASSTNRPANIMVDGVNVGQVAFPATGSFTSWATDSITATLSEGLKTIRVTAATGAGGPNVDYMYAPVTHQAEANTAKYGCGVASTWTGFTGSGYIDMGGNGSWFEWNNINSSADGTARLDFYYASSTERPCSISINNTVTQTVLFPATGGFNNWEIGTIDLPVNTGNNTIRVTASTSAGGPNVDKLELAMLNTTSSTIYEAESAGITSGMIKSHSGASNSQYVDGSGGFNLTFNNVNTSGSVTLKFQTKAPSGSRSMGVYVNGSKVGAISASSNTWSIGSVTTNLSSGNHTIELRDSEGTAELDVDYLEVIEN